MGRTRTKTKNVKPVVTKNTALEPAPAPSIPALLEKTQALIVQCNYELAGRFARRVLDTEPTNVEAKEMLGVTQLETGDLFAAKETFQSLIPPHPGAPAVPPPSAHLYLAQLSDDDPRLALQHYQTAVDILSGQLKGKERALDSAGTNDEDTETETKRNIVRALIGMVEIWMDPLSKLCDDPAAPTTCEDLLNLALQTDPGNTEALQTLASVRMSQERPDDAKVCLEQAWSQWKDLDLDDPNMPPIPARISIVRLFLELALYTPALLVLQGIIASDDQEVDAWYLQGLCFFLMAEQARLGTPVDDDLTWEELARDARDCLETCQTLHVSQEHPDTQLLDDTRERIAKLDSLGVQPSPEDEDDEDEGGWEDIEDSDEDDDVEMS